MKFFKRLHCQHEFETITNLAGDAINIFSRGKKVIRSIQTCTKCGKVKLNGSLDPKCDKVNDIHYYDIIND